MLRLTCVALLSAWVLGACASKTTEPRTEVLLEIDADAKIRAMADTLHIAMASGPKSAKTLTPNGPEVFDLKKQGFHWPASLALIAKPGHTDYAFEVTITAEAASGALARSRVRSTFLPNKTLVLSTSLFDICIGVLDCASDETCHGEQGNAQCISALIDPKTLPLFDSSESGKPMLIGGAGHFGTDSGTPRDAASDGAAPSDAQVKDPDAGAPRDSGSADAGSDASVKQDAASCVASGAEQCWNGIDDDCNGDIDCADTACGAVAVCAPAGSAVGVLVPDSDACPSGFDHGETLIHQGLQDPGCSGCNCSVSATSCLPSVYYYMTTAACSADQVLESGTLVGQPTYTCSSTPIGEAQQMETPVAWRAAMAATPGACNASGAPSTNPPIWSASMKLCTTITEGGGCSAGLVCVPQTNGSKACGEKGASSCPASTSTETWHRGYSDNRSCNACTCTTSGGDCDNVLVKLGHDWSCGTIDDTLAGGQKHCSLTTYAPPAILSGAPTNATCSASATTNGALTATGPLELCCTP